ncbi:Pentatricopeptide repeat-containing protein [Spatholobus suberectus]|nr:Pentatricopeptide repeat-containing protein [Spatholobus suberectus]
MPFSSQLRWSPYEFALCLQKCLKAKALSPGMQVHATLLTSGINMNILSLNSKLVGMYASCADLKSARLLFQKIERPNVFAFNWMVLGLAYNGYFDDALLYFIKMREVGHMGNNFTFSIVLKACVGLVDVNTGRQVHAMVCEMGFQNDVSVANALIDMYGKCGSISYARRVFDGMCERDVASWTSMICGFSNVGEIGQALMLFERMRLDGLEPNDFTWNAIIAAYARSSDRGKAFAFFERMKREGVIPDVVAWNALISGFVQNHQVREAFKIFWEMIVSGIQPNQVTVVAMLPACGSAGYIKWGREIHGFICRKGFDANVFIASALIDMYSKCGSVKDARNVFDKIPCKNVASWNAMIDCYGKCGLVDSSLALFAKMQEEGLRPNDVTFTCVLSACSHSGSVQKGLEIFSSMNECYGIEVSMQHYACVIDLLCRSGRTVEAYEFFKALPIQVTESMAGAFLNGCKVHGRRDLAKMMEEDIMRMKLNGPGSFVTLSNIYAADGDWEEVGNVRNVMKERNVRKQPGFSWLEKPGEILEGKKEKEGNNMASGLDMRDYII